MCSGRGGCIEVNLLTRRKAREHSLEDVRESTGHQGSIRQMHVPLGPVNTCMVVATEAIFSQDQAAPVPCSYSTPVSTNPGLRENGPVASGCAAKPAMRRCSSLIWNNQTSLLAWPDFRQ